MRLAMHAMKAVAQASGCHGHGIAGLRVRRASAIHLRRPAQDFAQAVMLPDLALRLSSCVCS
jgi:hypothetical protein